MPRNPRAGGRTLFIFSASVMTCVPLAAQLSCVQGTVFLQAENRAVPNAQVRLSYGDGRPHWANQFWTDHQGHYEYKWLTPGRYIISVLDGEKEVGRAPVFAPESGCGTANLPLAKTLKTLFPNSTSIPCRCEEPISKV